MKRLNQHFNTGGIIIFSTKMLKNSRPLRLQQEDYNKKTITRL